MPVLRSRIAHALAKPVPEPLWPPDHHPTADVAAMLREIGIALVETAQPVQVIEQRLTRIAARYTTAAVQVAVLPTMLFIQIGSTAHEMDGSAQPTGRFDAAGRVDEVTELAEAGAISPTDAVAAIRAARTRAPRFGALVTTLGYGLTTVGFGMLIQPSWKAMLAHLALGLLVGAIVAASRAVPSLSPVVPTLSALVVTVLATRFVADAADDGLLRVISPPLIATLPGMALVVGSIELAGGRIVSGASRTVYALAQLGLLVYGVVLGVRIAGEVAPQDPSPSMGPWTVYAAVLVIAVGLYFYLSAPAGSFGWLLLIIAVATLLQNVAGAVLNTGHSGFLAAMVAIPFAWLASRVRTAPPAGVLALAAFWSLLPGQLTFMSVSRGATDDYANVASMNVAGAAIVSTALGTLVGWSLVRSVRTRP